MECNSTLTYATIFMFLLHNLKACTSLLSKIKISTGIGITLHVLGSCKIKKKAQWASVQEIHNTKLIITKLTFVIFQGAFLLDVLPEFVHNKLMSNILLSARKRNLKKRERESKKE